MPRGRDLRRWAVTAALTVQAGIALAGEPTVWVFTAERLPALQNVARAERLFVLDRADNALQGLSFPNPGNATQARERAMAMIQSPQGQAALQRMRNSAEATLIAWQHGIEKLPAVLVDEQFVVYGVYDVESALTQIARFRHAR